MTPTRLHRTAGAKGRRGSAMILVLMLTFALAALAGSAILLSSSATMTVKSRESQHDLRYAADAAVAIGESQIANSPTVVPQTGFSEFVVNQPMLAADSAQVSNITYNLYAGLTGEVSRQQGRFITLVAQSVDSTHHRTFVRRVELIQESFAKFAYFSNNENGICFGSGDVLAGPVFSNGSISNCAGQNATFEDSVQAVVSVDSEPPGIYDDSWQAPPRATIAPISMPSTSGLASLFTIATTSGTIFTSPNANTDSTNLIRSRLEFDAYNDTASGSLAADSIQPGEGFVKFYQIDLTDTYWAHVPGGNLDSSASSYLRTGMTHYADMRNCGDWHFVADSNAGVAATYSWQFFPAIVYDSAWFYNPVANAGTPLVEGQHYAWIDGNGTYHWFVKDSGAGPTYKTGLDSNFKNTSATHAWLTNLTNSESSLLSTYTGGPTAARFWAVWLATITPQRDATAPAPVCYPAGDPHLVAIERVNWFSANGGYGHKGGVDSTFTYGNGGGPGLAIPVGYGVGHWSVYPSTITWANASFKTSHTDYAALFPIDTVNNASFQGVVAVHGSTGISGNVDGHITVYSDGNFGIIDNLRLVTGTTDTLCNHGMGIVAGSDILALDNAINVPQHWTSNDPSGSVLAHWVDLRPDNGGSGGISQQGASSFGGSLYAQSTVMALGSWGAEGLNADTNYLSTVYCSPAQPPDYYKRGCLYVFGSIIQNTRQTVNSGSGGPGGYGYAKQYTYDICAVQNPMPYFPTTGRLIENKYYEVNPNTFNATALYQALQGP